MRRLIISSLANTRQLWLCGECLQIEIETGNKLRQEATLGALGNVYQVSGDFEQADLLLQSSTPEPARELGIDAMKVKILEILVRSMKMGHQHAIEHYQQALTIFRDISNLRFVSINLGN